MQTEIFKLLIIAVFITASVFDIKTKGQRVPNYLSIILLCIAFVNPEFNLKGSLLGFLCGFAIFAGAYFINYLACVIKKIPATIGFGGADIKLTAAFGFAIGYWDLVLLAATIAVWGSLIYRFICKIISLITGRKKELTAEQLAELVIQEEGEDAKQLSPEELKEAFGKNVPVPVYFVPFIAAGAIFSLLLI